MDLVIKPFPKRYKVYLITSAVIAALINLPIFIFRKIDKIGVVLALEDIVLVLIAIGSLYLFDMVSNKFGRPYRRVIIPKLLILQLAVFLGTILTNEMELAAGFVDDDTIVLGSWEINPYWTNVVTNCVVWLLTGLVLLVSEDYIDKQQVNLIETREELNTIKTELYSANIRPHFIFNTLNGLLTLIRDEPDRAENLVIKLSDFLRNSLYSPEAINHSLKAEADLIREYLDIEKVRFGDRFHHEFHIEPDVEKVKVPRFFSLSLVENCIKHNGHIPGIKIAFRAYKQGDAVCIAVEDNGDPFSLPLLRNQGLKSTEALLYTRYEDNFTLGFENGDGVKQAIVRIPV